MRLSSRRRRFEVTAVDCSPIAIERARYRAEQSDVLLRFVLDDVFDFARSAGQFDFVYDAGLYHIIRQTNLDRYLDMLWRVMRPGSHYLCLACASDPAADDNRPQVTDDEINNELGRLFEFVHVRPTLLENSIHPVGVPGWSCLMLRPLVGKK